MYFEYEQTGQILLDGAALDESLQNGLYSKREMEDTVEQDNDQGANGDRAATAAETDLSADSTKPVPTAGSNNYVHLSRREKRRAETQARYKNWYDLAQVIKQERISSKQSHKPTELARLVARRLPEIRGKPGVVPASIHRRLNEHFPGWAD